MMTAHYHVLVTTPHRTWKSRPHGYHPAQTLRDRILARWIVEGGKLTLNRQFTKSVEGERGRAFVSVSQCRQDCQ
jgi:hypothetical protein